MRHDGPISIVTVLFDGVGGKTVPMYGERAGYSPEWADKLYRACARNLQREFQVVCLTHYKQEEFKEPVVAVPFLRDTRDWWCINEVMRPDLPVDRVLFVGLDTIITGSLEDLASYGGDMAMPRCPFKKVVPCNGMGLWKQSKVGHLWEKCARYAEGDRSLELANKIQPNHSIGSEMVFWRREYRGEIDLVGDLWGGQVVSFKVEWVKNRRLGTQQEGLGWKELNRDGVRLVYFHGAGKPCHLNPGLAYHKSLLEHWT